MNPKVAKAIVVAAALAAIAAGDPLPPRDWLMVRGRFPCTITSETHPSIPAQLRNCGWVADDAVCEGRRREDREWACQELLDELLGN
jgi:hypothetical protein